MDSTFVEKILAKYSGLSEVTPGQIVTVHPDHLLTHDNTAAIIEKIKPELEKYGVFSKSFPIISLDHVIPAASEKTAENHKLIREFKKLTGIPMVINTSFNIMGEPIVNQPSDAIRCFLGNGLDWLVLGDFIIEKQR